MFQSLGEITGSILMIIFRKYNLVVREYVITISGYIIA